VWRLALGFVLAATGCGGEGPTAPSAATGTISITSVGVPSGLMLNYGTGVDVQLAIDVSAVLLQPGRLPNGLPSPTSSFGVLCLSADGTHFTSSCTTFGVRGQGPVTARTEGPPSSSAVAVTRYVIAFLILAERFDGFGAGEEIPAHALSRHVMPWDIHWR